jgi:hypothetical protein
VYLTLLSEGDGFLQLKQFQLRDAPAAALLTLNMATVRTPKLCHSFGIQRGQTPNASSSTSDIERKSTWMKTTLLLHMWVGLKNHWNIHYPTPFMRLTTLFLMRPFDEASNKYKLKLTNTLRNKGYVISFIDVNSSLKSVPWNPHVRKLERHEISSNLFRKNFHDVIVRFGPVWYHWIQHGLSLLCAVAATPPSPATVHRRR